MDIQVAVLCDAATDDHGKLNILGTFDTIFASHLPAIHRQCTVALRLIFYKSEEGQHKISLTLVDEDGKRVLAPIEIPVELVLPGDSVYLSRNLIVSIQQLKFDRAGFYSLHIALDDRQQGSIPVLIKLLERQSPSA